MSSLFVLPLLLFMISKVCRVGEIVHSLVSVCSVYVCGFNIEDASESFEVECVNSFTL